MKKYINLGVGLGLLIAATSSFGFGLSATVALKKYYCNGVDFSSCSTTAPSNFIPTSPVFSTAVLDALAVRSTNNFITPMVAMVSDTSTPAILWFTSNAPNPANSPHQVLITMDNFNTTTLTGQTAGNNASIGIKSYYVPCGTNFPAEASPAGNVTGSTQINNTGISLFNGTSTCSTGGSIYFALAPTGLTNNFLPADTYNGNINLAITST